MNLSKFNFAQALGSLVAIVFYLIGPVVGVSVLPFGLRGSVAMRIDFVFVIPVILISIALLISIMPIGTLIIGLCGGSILVGFIQRVGDTAKALIPGFPNVDLTSLDVISSFVLNIGWGALAAALIMIISSIAGVFVMAMMEGNNGGGSGRGGNVRQSTGGGSTRGGAVGNIYRR